MTAVTKPFSPSLEPHLATWASLTRAPIGVVARPLSGRKAVHAAGRARSLPAQFTEGFARYAGLFAKVGMRRIGDEAGFGIHVREELGVGTWVNRSSLLRAR